MLHVAVTSSSFKMREHQFKALKLLVPRHNKNYSSSPSPTQMALTTLRSHNQETYGNHQE
jgi:hypothetical protein